MLDRTAHGGLQGCGLGAAQRQLQPELAQRAAATLVRAVQLDQCLAARPGVGLLASGRQYQWPGPGRPHNREPGHRESAFCQRANGTIQWHFKRWCADDQDHQRADQPPHRQPQQ
ncbi:Uncharacterised protein [Mycobacterium tuberculosis]|nr:Uncharacterised protein [Mycobacterium tuberculosis]